jgi:isocitrate/isopropylmalate dehydrogenase
MRASGFGLKAATITPEVAGDVGSPNAIVRKEINGTVILRTGRRIPGIRPVGGVFAPIAVVRMAVDDAYGATEWREGDGLDEWAYRTEKISRRTCRAVAETAFLYAKRMGGKVFGGPKYTVSPVYEGMLKEEMDLAAARHPEVRYSPQLIDATYALLMTAGDEPLAIPALNRDGDCLSDLVIQMFGSIAGAESLLLALDDNMRPTVVMAEAPHGTAPGLFGKNVANPLAMILAGSALLPYLDTKAATMASRAITEAALEAVYDGVRTADLGGHSHTTEFTDEVIRRVRTKLEVWPTLN